MVQSGSCAKLEMLDIRWSIALTAGTLKYVFSACPLLKCLGIYQSTNITSFAMSEILRSLPKLEILEYGAYRKTSVSESAFLPNLTRFCHALRSLSVINFTSDNPVADANIIEVLISGCPLLERINLCDPDPSLICVFSLTSKRSRSIMTQKWQCVLPPPGFTLDTVLSKVKYQQK